MSKKRNKLFYLVVYVFLFLNNIMIEIFIKILTSDKYTKKYLRNVRHLDTNIKDREKNLFKKKIVIHNQINDFSFRLCSLNLEFFFNSFNAF